jgi:hypothetical protein
MKFYHLFYVLFFPVLLSAQPYLVDESIVEVSGVVISRNDQNRMQYVPFVTVYVKNTSRGSYANYEGMFSIVIRKGETVSFSAIGFEETSITVPKDYKDMYFSTVIELKPKDLNLAEVVVFPWPDRDNFRAEFLAMEPTQALQMEEVARQNLNKRKMLEIGGEMGMDGRENAMYYLQQQASSYSYLGQARPTPILNPMAWAQFFKQIQDKKKKKNDDD